MAAKGTKDNPWTKSSDAGNKYYAGPDAIAEVERRLQLTDENRKLTELEKRIIGLEGFVDGYYLDSKGVLTRGVGQTEDYAKGNNSLSGFDGALKKHVDRAKKRPGMENFNSYSPKLKAELIQAEYRGDLGFSSKFRKRLKGAVTQEQLDAAADEFLDNDDYRKSVAANKKELNSSGIQKRMKAVADAVRNKNRNQGPQKQVVEASGKQVNSGNYEQIKNMVAGGTDNIIASRMPQEEIKPEGFKQLEQQMFNPMQSNYANQNLSNTQKDLGTVELPPDQTITPYRETIKEDVTVRPDQIRVNEDVQLSTIPNDARQYSIGEQQERARRSMMQGNRQDRMEDYQVNSEYQEDYPYLYPRNTGSYALPQQQAAQRMMGGGMGYAQGGTVNQAQGIASLGRGGDSTLVHMQPQEVAGLQQMAQANGTSLTTNPMTGYPEAFSLGKMFKAALPIAAGYFMGPAGMQMGMGASITAGAATGAGIAAVSGDDVLAGGLSGGLGGYSGFGMQGAFGGVGDAMSATGAATSDMGKQVAAEAAYGGSLGGMQTGVTNQAVGGSLTNVGQGLTGSGASMMTPEASMNPLATDALSGTSPMGRAYDKAASNLGTPASGGEVTQVDRFGTPTNFTPKVAATSAGPLQMAKTFGGPAVSMGLGGLEESDFYDDVDFSQSDPRDKYDPYSKLNLNNDTGVSAAMRADTGLRLLAKGGSINLNQQGQNLNQRGQNLNQRGQNVNSRGINIGGRGINTSALTGMQGLGSLNVKTGATSVSDEEQAILDKPLFKNLGFTGIGGGPSRVPYDYNPGNRISGGANYTTNRDGTFTRVGPVPEGSLEDQQQKIRDRLAGSGPTNLNTRGLNLSGKRKFAVGGYLKGPGDGMSDDIPATINGEQPAALSTGEYVVSADVVSGLGNGSSEAGAKRLHAMMDRVRKATTGRTAQAKEINPSKYMPA